MDKIFLFSSRTVRRAARRAEENRSSHDPVFLEMWCMVSADATQADREIGNVGMGDGRKDGEGL